MYEYRKLSQDEREDLVAERLAKGFPPHSPPHISGTSNQYLVTAACYNHAHIMILPERRQNMLDLLFDQMIMSGLEIVAWVILTDHYHLLIKTDDLGLLGYVLRLVHGRSSFVWNDEDGRKGRKVWYRYTDRAIRSHRHYYTSLNYIHYNPVKHGLVGSPYEWSCSSISWYLAEYGRQWLRDCWTQYPVRDYGKGWDD